MLVALLALSQSAAPASAPAAASAEGGGEPPRRVGAPEVRAAFPDHWRLPRADRAGQPLPSATFEAELRRLLREPLPASDDGSGHPAPLLGDLLRRARAAARAGAGAGGVDAARAQLDALLEEARSLVPAALWPAARELLDLRDFVSPRWDPDDEDERDGFLLGPTWSLPADCWPAHEGDRTVVQAAVFIAADLAAIKTCEGDFPRYFEYPANRYEEVRPVAGSYLWYGAAPEGEPPPAAGGLACAAATAIAVDFRNDLPFPYGGYSFRLHLLTALDAEDRPRSWVYSDGEDFHWMAGDDLFEPVLDGAGEFVGTLVLRQLGLDLDGVPDRVSHRLAGMRTVLGGLRRQAEALFDTRPAGTAPFPGSGAVPVAPLRGAAE